LKQHCSITLATVQQGMSVILGNAALLLFRSLSGLFLLASNDYDKELRKLQEITPDDFLIHLSTNADLICP